MKSHIKERLFWWAGVPALAAVLVALAVLQYRWSEQVSIANRAQMQSNLQTSLMGFRLDLQRELDAVCLELRSGADDSGSVRAADLSRRFQHWQQTAAHPALVEQVYLWRTGSDAPLQHLDPVHAQLETADWPPEFARLQQHLQAMSSFSFTNRPSNPAPRRHADHISARTGRVVDPFFFVPWFIDQSIPVMAHPLRQQPPSGDPTSPGTVTWIIVRLNSSVIEKEIFPELAQKYFRGPAGLGYHAAVVAGVPGRQNILYASDSSFAGQKSLAFDAALNLFGPPFRRLDQVSAVDQVFLTRAAGAAGMRPSQPDDRRGSSLDRLVRLEPFQYSADGGVWQIGAQHQSGSVEAAVGNLRRRHLMVSFGVLVLLAVTMAMVLVASQRARRLAALQMDFVAGVSHELRTPLAVISTAAENIAHGVVADQQQLERYGTSILKQTRQLTQLVEQVLVFAATQQKQGQYQLRPVQVEEVIEAALENTAGMTAAAGITVERNVDPHLPPVAADFAALSQCLQNLITNAIKYGADGHWMGVRAVARKEKDTVREIEITVEDRGIGISAAEIKHIFEPFYRSPAVTGSNVHGTGLGLPLARTVIEAMRGTLTVASEPGKGSSFTIHLAAAAGLRLAGHETASDGIPGETADYYP